MSDPPTQMAAQGYLNHLRELRGDRCYETCSHSVAANPSERCLEARAAGVLMTRKEFIESLRGCPGLDVGDDNMWVMVDLGLLDATLEEDTE